MRNGIIPYVYLVPDIKSREMPDAIHGSPRTGIVSDGGFIFQGVFISEKGK
jgi:hypothetical protein